VETLIEDLDIVDSIVGEDHNTQILTIGRLASGKEI